MPLNHPLSASSCVAGPLLGESFLETPTAFGVPLGVLLLFMYLLRTIRESGAQSQPAASAGTVQRVAENTSHSFEKVWCPNCGGKKVVHVSAVGLPTTCSHCSHTFVAALKAVAGTPQHLTGQQFIDAKCTACGKPNTIERGNIGTLLFCKHCHSNYHYRAEARQIQQLPPERPIANRVPPLIPEKGVGRREGASPSKPQERTLACPSCSSPIRIHARQEGLTVKCSNCGAGFKTRKGRK